MNETLTKSEPTPRQNVLVRLTDNKTFRGYITSETTTGAFVKSVEKWNFESDLSPGEWIANKFITLI